MATKHGGIVNLNALRAGVPWWKWWCRFSGSFYSAEPKWRTSSLFQLQRGVTTYARFYRSSPMSLAHLRVIFHRPTTTTDANGKNYRFKINYLDGKFQTLYDKFATHCVCQCVCIFITAWMNEIIRPYVLLYRFVNYFVCGCHPRYKAWHSAHFSQGRIASLLSRV